MATVDVYELKGRIPKILKDTLDARTVYRNFTLGECRQADYVVTRSALSVRVEWRATRLGAITVVLPEAGDWLAAKVAAHQGKDPVRIVVWSPSVVLV